MKSLKVLLILVIVYILLNYNEVKQQVPELLNQIPFINTEVQKESNEIIHLGNNSLKQNTKQDKKSTQEKELQQFLQLEIDNHLSHSKQNYRRVVT
tara:strand:- start:8091 stop:8378 length:288 start_codon:yes stop_codon:yes gene_type:complete